MTEQILEKLIPLVSQAGEGAFWLVFWYFTIIVVQYVLTAGVILLVVRWAYKLFMAMIHGTTLKGVLKSRYYLSESEAQHVALYMENVSTKRDLIHYVERNMK